MADPTQNSNGTPGQPAQPGQAPQPGQGPARTGASSSQNTADAMAALDAFNRAIPAIAAIAAQVDKLVEKMEAVAKGTESVKKKTRDWGNELHTAISYADNIEDSIKALFEYQKQMAKQGLNAKSYKEVADLLEDMEKQNKRLVDEGVFSKKNARVIQKNTEALRRGISQVKQGMNEAFDPAKVSSMMSQLMRMNKLTLDVAKNVKGIRMTGLQTDMHHATRSLNHLFQRKPGRVDKYHAYANVATGIKAARRERMAGRHSAFNAKRDEIHAAALGLGFHPDDIGFAASLHAGKRGYGRVGQSVMARYSEDRLAGRKHGVLTRAGMHVLARGEGHMGRGIASIGAGMLEGGAAGIAEMAGPLAPALAGLEVLKLAFDKNQKMNADVAEGLGKGGAFGTGNPIDGIRVVRNNLNGPIYSPLGIGYEKNLAIAKTLQETGLSTQNLANANLGSSKSGFVNGSFGHVQQNVYAYGRLAGLDSTQTVNETLKLVAQYKQSLESTHDFFGTVTKDAATAGLTTTKYIQLLDDVNSHYDRSNKLLGATVDTMRLLSVTGRNTAEDLKDAMDTVTNGGQKRDLGQSTYLNQQILADPEMTALYQSRLNTQKQDALDQVSSAMGRGHDAATLGPKLEKDLQGTISALLTEAEQKFKGDPLALQAASKTIESLRTAQVKQNTFRYAQGDGVNRGGLDLAVSGSLVGDDVNTQAMQTLASFKRVFKDGKFNISDLLSSNSALLSDPRFKMFSETLGTDPTKAVRNLSGMAHDAATARIDVVGKGLSDKDRNDPNSDLRKLAEKTYDVLKESGMKFGPGNKYDALYNAAQDPGKRSDMIARLSKTEMSATDAFGNPIIARALSSKATDDERNARIAKAESLSAGTRTTADIYADAFSHFFNKLQVPLDFIASVIDAIGKHLPGVKMPAMSTEGQRAAFDERIGSGKATAALNAYDNQINDLQDKVNQTAPGPAQDKLKAQLQKAKDNRDAIQNAMDNAKNGSARTQESAETVTKATSAVDNMPFDHRNKLNAQDMAQLLTDIGAPGLKVGQTSAPIDANVFKNLEGKIDQLPDGYKLNDLGKDAAGNTIHSVTNNYTSVGLTQEQEAQNAANVSGEVAKRNGTGK